jgi:acetyl-CoA carboxylase biotin carboxylase subunit
MRKIRTTIISPAPEKSPCCSPGPGIRLDSGVYEGWTVPIDYDPLLAKVVGYGQDRTQAISRLVRAFEEFFVAGIKTNAGLFQRILADEDFRSGNIDTGYLERLLKSESGEEKKDTSEVAAVAAAIFAMLDSAPRVSNGAVCKNPADAADTSATVSGWKRAARVEGLM